MLQFCNKNEVLKQWVHKCTQSMPPKRTLFNCPLPVSMSPITCRICWYWSHILHTACLKCALAFKERKSKQMFVYRNAIRCVFLITNACGWFNAYKKAMRNTWRAWKDECLIFVASLKICYYCAFCTVFFGLSTRNIELFSLASVYSTSDTIYFTESKCE